MTEEDIKYRQGRSKKQADNNEKLAFISFIAAVVTFVIAIIIVQR